jgi:hypothetical protein
MTYRIRAFKRTDQYDLLQAGGECIGGHHDPSWDTLCFMEANPSWTLEHDGQPIASGGYFPMWTGRYWAWALLNGLTRKHMTPITRYARQVLGTCPGGRLEISVRKDFQAGHRWARLLGFHIETPLLRQFGPDGADHVGYVRFIGAR